MSNSRRLSSATVLPLIVAALCGSSAAHAADCRVQVVGGVPTLMIDQVSFKYFDKLKDDPNLKTWEYQLGLTRTPEEFVWMNRREIGMALAHGVQTAHFDIHGGYYEDPVILDGVQRLGEIRAESLGADRSSIAEILVLVDERSAHYVRFRNPADTPGMFLTSLLSAQVAQLGFVAPYDAALLSDLGALDTARYKLVLVLNAFYLDATQRQVIAERLQTQNKTILWFYAPGYFDETRGSVAGIAQVTGIRVAADSTSGGESRVAWTTHLPVPPGTDWPPVPDQLADLAIRPAVADPLIVVDPRTTALAAACDDPARVVVARRDMEGWTSIYSSVAPLPALLLKRLAAEAGVHIYDTDPSHLLCANGRFLTIAANAQGGPAVIRLPHNSRVVDACTRETVAADAREFTLPLRPKEVRLFRLE